MTPKQEAFARAYVETGNASEAYRRSYNAVNMKEQSVWRKAKECIDNGKVAARVAELHLAAQKKTIVTVEKLTLMAMKAYDEAQRVAPTSGQMQTSAMVKATEFIGKLHGLVVEKSEVKHVSSVEDLNDADLTDIARSGRNGTAQTTPGASRAN